MNDSSIGLGQRRWERDTGIDPESDLMDQIREDEVIQNSNNLGINALATLAYFLTFPLSVFCACKKVDVMQDVVVTQCGVVTKVLRKPGLHHINPCFTDTREVYMGLNDIEISKMNANDSHGNPLVVSAQFVYRVSDSVTATYRTSVLTKFLKEQGESAIRAAMSHYPFDNEGGKGECLRKHSDVIEAHLVKILQEMVQMVGIKIESFRIINVGFDPRMEKLLLARQEAQAEVTARTAIAEGTTGILQETLGRLKALGIELGDEERNKFATNLTLMLVNHGHTTINLFQETAPSPLRMTSNLKGKEKELS